MLIVNLKYINPNFLKKILNVTFQSLSFVLGKRKIDKMTLKYSLSLNFLE